MKNQFFGLVLLALFLPIFSYAENTYVTSKGAVFNQVQGPSGQGGSFGLSWKDPSGTIWSSDQGVFQFRTCLGCDAYSVIDSIGHVDGVASDQCKRIGGTLPTDQDYQNLESYFDFANYTCGDTGGSLYGSSNTGVKDLDFLFPAKTDWLGSPSCDKHPQSFWTSTPDTDYGYEDITDRIHALGGGVSPSQLNHVRCISK